MNVIRCGNGHFFDADVTPVCPFCNKQEDAPTIAEMVNESGPDYRNDLTIMEIAGDRELGKQLTQMYVEESDTVDDDNEKTIGLSFTAGGINPVVGWLVCEEGPERGRSYPLYAGRNFIGRSHSSDVSIYDDNTITRDNHCSIIFEPNESVFFIAPSQNAITTYKGRTLRDAELLENEETFSIGNSTFRMIAYCKKGRSWI